MDLEELKNYLASLSQSLSDEARDLLAARLRSLISVFPFNEYEYTLMFLLDRNAITFQEYEGFRNDYVSSHRYLEFYELAPRVFGEIWAHKHIQDLDRRFLKPNRLIDPYYNGQYDLWIDGVRVEVKAARAINTQKRGSLVSKALRYDSPEPFWMNYQQIKVDESDVFVFVGLWIDRIFYWVLSRGEVTTNRYLSHQHRGGIEFQIGITHKNIRDFEEYIVNPGELGDRVVQKGQQ